MWGMERAALSLAICHWWQGIIPVTTVASRGLVMPRATAWLDASLPNSSIEQWRRSMMAIVTKYTLFVTSRYDAILTFANERCGVVCWYNIYIQGRRSSGRAGGAVKQLMAMETYKKQKNRYQFSLFLFIKHVDLKNNTRNYKKLFWIIWVPK